MDKETFGREYGQFFGSPEIPRHFVCSECGKIKSQDQTKTQRYGYPLCHGITMRVYEGDNNET